MSPRELFCDFAEKKKKTTKIDKIMRTASGTEYTDENTEVLRWLWHYSQSCIKDFLMLIYF